MASDPSEHDEIRRFEEQYRSNPDGLVFARLADAYRKAGELDRALTLLREGIGRHPDYPSAHIVRARTLVDLERPSDAEASLRRVLELDAQNLVAMRGLASLAEKRQDPVEAVYWYEQIVALDPMNVEAEAGLERLRRERPTPLPGLQPLPAPREEWWSSPAFEIPAQAPDGEDPVDFSADGLGGGPVRDEVERPEPAAEASAADPAPLDAPDAAPDGPDGQKASGAAWWFEDPGDDEPAEDGDLLTRTMAELYAKQGLVDEAIAIYRELLADRPGDEDLERALEDLERRAEGDGTDGAGEVGGDTSGTGDEVPRASDGTPGAGVRAAGRPGPAVSGPADPRADHAPSEARAESVVPGDGPPTEEPVVDRYASHPVPRTAGESEFYRDWIRRLRA